MAGLHEDKNVSLFEMTLTLWQQLNSLHLAAVRVWVHLLNQDVAAEGSEVRQGS